MDDMVERKLYEGPKPIAEHDLTHVKNVLLYAMKMGNDLGLSSHEMDMLIACSKYHDSGIVGATAHTGHSMRSAQKAFTDLSGTFEQSDMDIIRAVIEFHEEEDIDKNTYEINEAVLNEVCRKYQITDSKEIEKARKIGNILKDADALDRTRFPGNINTNYFRNKSQATNLLKMSFQIREAIGKESINERIQNNSYTQEELKAYYYLYNALEYPNCVIDYALKYYKNFGITPIQLAERKMKGANL